MEKGILLKILKEEKDNYINNIARELEESHNKWFDSFGFPIFGEKSKDYHEQVYFESYLESYTRKMLNFILKRIFDEELTIPIIWPEFEYIGVYNGYTNVECEDQFGFEFICPKERIGYRYTDIKPGEIENVLSKCKLQIDTVKVIKWDKIDSVYYSYEDNRIQVMLAKELFYDLFVELEKNEIDMMFTLVVDYISTAVKEANSMISLVTLPGFTPAYLYKNRNSIIDNLVSEIEGITSFYIRNKNYKDTEVASRCLVEDFNLPQIFLDRNMKYAFVGNSCFAKCFLTSEYLFRFFETNPIFDYTPIVSGYIKSIEQVLHEICLAYRNFKGIQLDLHSFTMGKYIQFLRDHDDILDDNIRPAKDIIEKCLQSYRIENRNNLFHRDYFDKWERVIIIRKNTVFLYAVLLGGVSMSILKSNPKTLGLIDDDYNRLFELLDSRRDATYIILIDGKEYKGMQLTHRAEGVFFDRQGIIKNGLHFRRYDYDHWDEIVITKERVPISIWKSDIHGNKVEKVW